MGESSKTRRCFEELKNSKLTPAQKKLYVAGVLTKLGGDDCPLEALSLIMGRNYTLCKEQMETLQALIDILCEDNGNLYKTYGLSQSELIGMLIDCDIIFIFMKLFAAQMCKWSELANCGKDKQSSSRMTVCLVQIRIDCLLIVNFICNNPVCRLMTGSDHLRQLCNAQLSTSNAFGLLISSVENDPSVIISFYSLVLLSKLTERYLTREVFEKYDRQLSLVKLGQYLIKDTLAAKMFTWLKQGDVSDREKKLLIGVPEDSSTKGYWIAASQKKCTPENIRDSAHRWCILTFNQCVSAIMSLIGLHLSKKTLRTFVTDEPVFKGLIRWARTIPLHSDDMGRTKNCVKLYSTLISEYDVVVDILLNDDDFMEAVQLGLRHADSSLGTYFLMCLAGMAKKNASARKKLVEKEGLLKLIVRCCFSVHSEMQTVAIYSLYSLVDRETAPQIVKLGFTLQILGFLLHIYHACDNLCTLLINLRCRLERYTTSRDEPAQRPINRNMTPDIMMTNKSVGNDLYKNKEYQKAEELYSQIIDCCPPMIRARFSSQQKTEVLDPEWYTFPATLYSNRAQCYLYLKDFDKAITDCDEAIIRSDSECPESHNLLLKSILRRSTAFYEKEMWTESLMDIGFCIMEDPNNSFFRLHFNKVFKKYREVFGYERLVKRCAVCLYGEGEKLKRCANCTERYCSRLCQKKAWDEGHKDECSQKNGTT